MKLLIIGKGGTSQKSLISYLHGSHSIVSVVEEGSVWKTFFSRLRKRGVIKTANQYLFTLLVKSQGLCTKNTPVLSNDVKKVKIVTLNSLELFDLIGRENPDYIVLAGASILKLNYVPDSFKTKILNIHLGITPAFRGVYGGFWSIYSGRSDLFGTTLHFVDAGIDTGKIIGQSIVTPVSLLNIHKQNRQLYIAGYQLLDEFLRDETMSKIKLEVNMNILWSHPTIIQYLIMLMKVKWKVIMKS